MSQVLSRAQIELIVNGHRVEGYADEDRPVEFPTGDEMATVQTGADGGVYATSVPMFGGAIMIRLQPASPSVQWFCNEKERWKQDNINGRPITVYEGTYSDPAQGRSATLEGGILQQCPDISEPGITFEIAIYFEKITPDLDSANFAAKLTSPATLATL